MSVHIEPHEVLAHLNRMGFYNVTTDQLRKFIGDLKKLIKYDLRECTRRVSPADSPGTSYHVSDIDASNPESPYTMYRTEDESPQERSSYVCESSRHNEEADDSYSSDGNISRHKLKQVRGKKYSKTEKQESRPRSAFIKPWNLETTSKSRKSDPVALYHKYQTIWQQQKVPGDNGHVDLRWNIREKMLGGDPQPRPVPRATSIERIHGYRGHTGCPLF